MTERESVRSQEAGVGGKRVVCCLMSVLLAVCVSQSMAGQEPRSEWEQAHPDRALEFPRDHASHPNYRIEWWYYTGNLEGDDGRRFGYQVTFFRVGVDRDPENPSVWAVRDLYMAHLAVTDLDRGQHLVSERLNRAGVSWAGARTDRLYVWNEDWHLRAEEGHHLLRAISDDGQFGVDLRLAADQPPVLHGRDGFSQKGLQRGNASHYYSLTRMETTGELQLGGERMSVTGLSWMDHEFGTTFLEPSQQGWDWFSLQLDDGSDIMVYVLRQQDGTRDSHSSGTLVFPDGQVLALAPDDIELVPDRQWVSPTSRARYPVEWTVEVPGESLRLEVRAAVDAQELHTEQSTGVTYWEGAVVITGTRQGRSVGGRGYLEMTGYAGRPMSEVLR